MFGFTFGRGGSSSPSTVPQRGSLVNALPGAADVQSLLKGIPQRGNVLGKATAPATIVEYIDLQCPFCQQFERQAMPTLIQQYVLTGKAKVVMRPIAFIGPDSQLGRLAAIAAGRQNKMFNFAELLYLNQGAENSGWLQNSTITAVAASVPGLDVPKLLTDRNATATKSNAAAFDRLSTRDAVSRDADDPGRKDRRPAPAGIALLAVGRPVHCDRAESRPGLGRTPGRFRVVGPPYGADKAHRRLPHLAYCFPGVAVHHF